MTTIRLTASDAPADSLTEMKYFYGVDELDRWLLHHLRPDGMVTSENMREFEQLAFAHGWAVQITEEK